MILKVLAIISGVLLFVYGVFLLIQHKCRNTEVEPKSIKSYRREFYEQTH